MNGNFEATFDVEPRDFDPNQRNYPPLYPDARMYLHLVWDADGRIAGFGGLFEHVESAVGRQGYTASHTLRLISAGLCPTRGQRVAVSDAHERNVLTRLMLATEHLGQLVTARVNHDEVERLDDRLERHGLTSVIPYSWFYKFVAALGPNETLVSRCHDLGIPCMPDLQVTQADEADKARLHAIVAALLCVHQYQADRRTGQVSSGGCANLAAWIQRDPGLVAIYRLSEAIARQEGSNLWTG
ncbi:hypothetical protein J3454_10930 [Erythrobacter sp. NFXS35]|uniref:hypothetical protein n=1 Tax=Erythrobacter sp. NFXS35 TaxID=2818436 RepID=UPI0032DF5BBD